MGENGTRPNTKYTGIFPPTPFHFAVILCWPHHLRNKRSFLDHLLSYFAKSLAVRHLRKQAFLSRPPCCHRLHAISEISMSFSGHFLSYLAKSVPVTVSHLRNKRFFLDKLLSSFARHLRNKHVFFQVTFCRILRSPLLLLLVISGTSFFFYPDQLLSTFARHLRNKHVFLGHFLSYLAKSVVVTVNHLRNKHFFPRPPAVNVCTS